MADKEKKRKTRAEMYHGHKGRKAKKTGFLLRSTVWKKKRVFAGDKLTVSENQYANLEAEKMIGEKAPSDQECKRMNAPHRKAAEEAAK